MAANNKTIIRSHDTKANLITYRMEDKRLNFPPHRKMMIDGLKVGLELNTGETLWLPNLESGYRIKEITKWQLVFEKMN